MGSWKVERALVIVRRAGFGMLEFYTRGKENEIFDDFRLDNWNKRVVFVDYSDVQIWNFIV